MKINKNSAVPLYQQLVDTIRQQISEGVLKENDKLRTELELSRDYGVSRITVRKAIEILVDEGYVTKKQGIGTFVSAKKLNQVVEKVLGFTQMCQLDGKTPSTELVSVEWIRNQPAVSRRLKISEEDRILKIVRIRKCDGRPVMLEESYYPPRFSYLMSEDLTGSTYEILQKHGMIPTHGVKTIEICYARKEEAEALHVKENQALLLQKDISTDQNGQIFHYSKVVVNSEVYKLTVMI